MEANPDLAVFAALVREGVFHGRDRVRGCAREVVRPHRDRDVAVAVDLVVLEDDLGPALLAVDGEAACLLYTSPSPRD